MKLGRTTPPPRQPHPDSRVEAQLRRVLSLYAAVERTEGRLEDITAEQRTLDAKYRSNIGFEAGTNHVVQQADRLRQERFELEAFIARAHEDITKLLTDLGDDALSLYGWMA
jgi:hypothetical protein